MLAARMYGVNDIRLEEVPTPTPGNGELLIKVAAAAVCGTDVRMITNGASGINKDNPLILGHELAGTIAAVGDHVTGYQVGDRVAVAPNMGCGICDSCIRGNGHLCPEYKALGINLDGGFAEYCVIPETAVRAGNVSILEENVSFEEGAVNEPLSCVCNGFEHAHIHPGDRVLVIGAGPIGIMHCALALMAGAVVYLNDVSADRLAMAKNLYPQIHTLLGPLKTLVTEVTNGCGMDVIITACPSPEMQTLALELAALGGRVVFFGGIPASKEPVSIDTNLVHYKQLILTGTTRASLAQYRNTLKYISSGVLNVKPLITAHFPLKEIHKAIETARLGQGLKNIITFE